MQCGGDSINVETLIIPLYMDLAVHELTITLTFDD